MSKREFDSKAARRLGEDIMDGVKEGIEDSPEVSSEERVEKPMLKNFFGVVTGAPHLNVRDKPSADARVVCIIRAGASVEVDPNKSTAEFYRVTLAAGPEGYCAKQYITPKK